MLLLKLAYCCSEANVQGLACTLAVHSEAAVGFDCNAPGLYKSSGVASITEYISDSTLDLEI